MGKATTLAVLLALALPLPAAAARAVAPPGNAEADQYFETVPDSAGTRSPAAVAKPGQGAREGKLEVATERSLERRGAAGQAVTDVVVKTAPPGVASGGAPSGPATAGVQTPKEQGLGALFPLVLALSAAAALAFAVVRRRPHARSVRR